jgi:hypothetical protein
LQLVDALGPIPSPSSTNGHTHGRHTIASGCPFCMTMLTDGLKNKSLEDTIAQMDVAELLERSCVAVASREDAPPPAGSGDDLSPPLEAAAG